MCYNKLDFINYVECINKYFEVWYFIAEYCYLNLSINNFDEDQVQGSILRLFVVI